MNKNKHFEFMRKLLFLLLACCPIICAAQSEWETPNAAKPANEVKKEQKKEDNAGRKDAADTAQENIKDWKYIRQGAVPEVNGKVVFAYDVDVPGKSAQQVYDATYAALDSLAHGENQIASGIALINRKEHIIAARYQEWLEFSRSFISLDRTKFSYTIVATCSDNHLHLTLERIAYNYEEERPTGFKTTAEKWIADKYAVNKKRTKLVSGTAKFRKKTIDRKDNIFMYISDRVKR